MNSDFLRGFREEFEKTGAKKIKLGKTLLSLLRDPKQAKRLGNIVGKTAPGKTMRGLELVS